MAREVDLIGYLPSFVSDFKEMREIAKTENLEFEKIYGIAEKALNNQFIFSSDEEGILKFERMLGLSFTQDDDLRARQSRVFIKWNDDIPYTLRVLADKLDSLCGRGNFQVDVADYILNLTTSLKLSSEITELEKLLRNLLPANIEYHIKNRMNYDSESEVVGAGIISKVISYEM